MGFLKKIFNKKEQNRNIVPMIKEKTVLKKQKILDAFIDHGLCSLKHNCKSYIESGKCLQAQDIKYIYERIIKLVGLMGDDKPRYCNQIRERQVVK